MSQDDKSQTALRHINGWDRSKICRLMCGNDALCDIPCGECPRSVTDAVTRVMAAIAAAGCVVMARERKV